MEKCQPYMCIGASLNGAKHKASIKPGWEPGSEAKENMQNYIYFISKKGDKSGRREGAQSQRSIKRLIGNRQDFSS